MHKRDNQNIQILPRQLIQREISRLMVGESIPPMNHTSDSSHTSNLQHPAWPRANFDPKLPATRALSLFPQLGTRTKVKCCSAQKGQYLHSGVGTVCSLLSSLGNGCGWSSEKASLHIKLVTYLQSPSLSSCFAYPPNDLHPPAAPKGPRQPRGDVRCGEMRLQAIPAAARLRAGRREPRQSSTAADEKALSLLGRVSNPLEKA